MVSSNFAIPRSLAALSIPSPVRLEAGAVVLRTLLPEDADAMHKAIEESAAELSTTMGWWHDGYTVSETREWARLCQSLWERGQHYEFAILSNGSELYLGSCSIGINSWHARTANLGYWVRTSATRRGSASVAARRAAQWACDVLSMQRVEVLVVPSNTPSLHTALRAGAIREGLLRNRLRWNNESYDAVTFSFVPSDFQP